MQRVNAEYANRVTKVLDNAIGSLKNISDDGAGPPDLVNELKSLREEVFDTLTLTLVDDESLRSDVRKFECERATKDREFVKLEARLRDVRREREERRAELSSELTGLNAAFEEKRGALANEQTSKEERELSELERQRGTFEKECEELERKRDEFKLQYEDQKRCHGDEESRLQVTVASIKMDLLNISTDHDAAVTAKQTAIESERTLLEQQQGRRIELEEHFKRVDRDNANRKEEEEQLRKVCELEEKAMSLLDEGAVSLQKLWRGIKDREAVTVAKMKSKKKKKGGKKKGGKKKKA